MIFVRVFFQSQIKEEWNVENNDRIAQVSTDYFLIRVVLRHIRLVASKLFFVVQRKNMNKNRLFYKKYLKKIEYNVHRVQWLQQKVKKEECASKSESS